MKLYEARNIVKRALGGTICSDMSKLDDGIKVALDRLIRTADVTRNTDTVSLLANVATADFSSITRFDQGKIMRMQTGYSDQGTWAVGTAYVVNDLVVGDGSPDALYYRCTTANTGNEPPNSAYWEKVFWGGGFPIQNSDYSYVAEMLTNQGKTGRPEYLGFSDKDNAIVWPVPDINYDLTVWHRGPLVSWDSGTSDDITLNVEDQFLTEGLWWGASAVIAYEDPTNRYGSTQWSRFNEYLKEVKRDTTYKPGVWVKSSSDFNVQ